MFDLLLGFGWPSCPGSVTSAAYWAATIPNFAKTWRYIALENIFRFQTDYIGLSVKLDHF